MPDPSGDPIAEVLAIVGAGPGDDWHGSLTAEAGAYLLVIRLASPLSLSIPTLPRGPLATGCYVYAGSARGPGGIRARVLRHARRGKSWHWHVDALTEAAAGIEAVAVPGGDECALAASLVAHPAFEVAVPAFGSSDCRACPSHLFRLRPGVTPAPSAR